MDRQAEQSDKAREQYRIQVRKFDEAKDNLDKECKVMVIRKSDSLCPVPPDGPMYKYYYSNLDQHEMENCRKQFFSVEIDSIDGINEFDTVIFLGPGAFMNFNEIDGPEWPGDELEDQMKDIQIDIEREYRDAEYPPFPRHDRQMREFSYEFGTAPDERIIRQELIDDGLATPRKKYIIDLDSPDVQAPCRKP
jgi:hypothetical protein